ncbi:MAG: topoisomerase family protein [Pseudomonadota bacterium]
MSSQPGISLVIAEKPSVASDIARALGGFSKKDDFFEREDMIIGSAVGHLLEIAAPDQYEVKRGKWSFAHLPVIPPHFDLRPLPKTEQRLKLLARLIKRKEVVRIINACDAGREGELIFRTIVRYTKAKQPIARLWLQSMTPESIRKAFDQLRTDADVLPLAQAAQCRAEADWLVGINGTRAMTAFNSKEGGFFLTTVGRVQTPTLSIVVEREEAIRQFVPKSYFEVTATFQAKNGQYEGKWFDPSFKKSDAAPDARAERLWSLEAAQAIVTQCQGKPVVVKDDAKSSTQAPPALFDLTTLQREANARFGFSAKNSLGIAQALYEKHKLLTYPRTDSKALPEDYIETVKATLSALSQTDAYGQLSRQILKSQWVQPNKRVFDNTKVSDHFAIVPTGQLPKTLSEPEAKIFDLVCRRFLAIFFPAAEYLNTSRISAIEQHQFRTEGKILVKPGWLSVYGREAIAAEGALVEVGPDESVRTLTVESQGLQTRPPARYSEATLLSAMEGAGRFVDDDELREALAGKGLGTPATRAAIIEGLINEKYLLREGRELIPTAKAQQLATLLRGLDVKELSKPELTGEWEYKLRQIEQKALAPDAFMAEISRLTQHIVDQAKNYNSDTIPGDYLTLKTPCPKCGGVVKENYRRYNCGACDFSISKIPGSRTFEPAEVETLLQTGALGPVDGFRSKLGRPFAAQLRLTADHKLEFDFGNGGSGDNDAPVDFSAEESLGPCPKCQSRVFAHGSSYICEHSVGPEKTCDFRSGMVILQQSISREQMTKLLVEGKTSLLEEFVSARTKRRFKAFLVKTPEGKVGFEFAPKAAKATRGKKAGKTSAEPADAA